MGFILFSLVVGLCFSISGCERGLKNLVPVPTGSTSQSTSPAAPTLAFSIQPNKVAEGGSATLTWTSTNATTVTINNGIGNVAPSGSLAITAKTSQQFTAIASGPGGTVEDHVAVTVLSLPTITVAVCPAAEPQCDGGASTLIRKNSSAIISWQAQNATSVSIDQVPNQQFGIEDSFTIASLADSTTYVVTAVGPGGTSSASATVNVTSFVPDHRYVALVVEENHSYSQVIGNPRMPFLNELAAKGALATEYFANTHGSLRDYFELTAGQFLVSGGDFQWERHGR